MALFPNSLTEEEETLQKKYAKLKKKVEMHTAAREVFMEDFVQGVCRITCQKSSIIMG